MPLNREDFEIGLAETLQAARNQGRETVTVRAGDLHRKLGDYPGPDHRMPICCGVMTRRKGDQDTIIDQPPKGVGASLEIRYVL